MKCLISAASNFGERTNVFRRDVEASLRKKIGANFKFGKRVGAKKFGIVGIGKFNRKSSKEGEGVDENDQKTRNRVSKNQVII